MNIVLWVLQAALAFLCIAGGLYKITHFEQLQGMMASMRTLPRALWMSIGVFETLAGIGLVLPALSPYAAGAVVVESVLISAIYLNYGDRAPVPFTAVMAVLAVLIAYGRFVLKPF